MQFYKSVFYQKNEALLFITTLLQHYRVWKYLIRWSRKTNPKVRGTLKSLPKIVSKRSHQEECVQSAQTARCLAPCVPSQVLQVTDELPSFPSKAELISDWRIDFQTTLPSRSQRESSAGKPVTSRSTIQTTRQKLRTTSPHGAGMKGSATSEGQKDNFFLQNEDLFKASTWSLVSQLHACEKWRRCSNHNYQKIRLECYRSKSIDGLTKG